jgi:hypothetical protein
MFKGFTHRNLITAFPHGNEDDDEEEEEEEEEEDEDDSVFTN